MKLKTVLTGLIRTGFLSALLGTTVHAQGLRVGVKAGVPLESYFEGGFIGSSHLGFDEFTSATRRYILGVSAELLVSRTFGVEVDGLYHRVGYVRTQTVNVQTAGFFSESDLEVKGHSWDFPLMAKYRWGQASSPYVVGGGVLRYIGPISGHGSMTVGNFIDGTKTTTPIDLAEPPELNKRFYPGLTAGLGVELALHGTRVRLSPEIRYTRWMSDIPSSDTDDVLHLGRNQADFLLGITF